MGHERLVARRAESDETRLRRPAPDPRLAMAAALGNSRFTALLDVLEPRPAQRAPVATVARLLKSPLAASLGGADPITVGLVREFKTTIETGWNDFITEPSQWPFVEEKFDAVQDRITKADVAFQALEVAARTVNANAPDAASLSKAQASAKQGALGQHVFDVVSNLSRAAQVINAAHAEWMKDFGDLVAEPEWKKKETEKQEQASKTEKEEKEKQWAAQAEREKKASKEEKAEDDEKGPPGFPHDGKHQPPPRLMKYADKLRDQGLEELTGKPKAVALYKSNVPAVVIAWELQAMNEGLELHDNFTTIYGFTHTIGADSGGMTRFIRCEGEHHGHPLQEEGATSFNDYMRTEVAKANGNNERLQVLRAFCLKVNVPAARYGI